MDTPTTETPKLSLKSKTANAVLVFAEEIGIKAFVGAGTYYVLKSGQINTLGDLKALATAGALAAVVWAVGALKTK